VSAGTVSFSTSSAGGITVNGSMDLSVTTNWITSSFVLAFANAGAVNIRTTSSVIPGFTMSGGGTFTLLDDLTTLSTGTVTLTTGTLSLGSFALSTGKFSSTGSGTRGINFGTGSITCRDTSGTLWTTATATNLTISGTTTAGVQNRTVNISSSGTTTATVVAGTTGGTEANSVDFNFTSGSYTLTLTANSKFRGLSFAGTYSGTVGNTALTLYGGLNLGTSGNFTAGSNTWTFASTSTLNTITSNSKTIDFPITFNGVGGKWTLSDALSIANKTFTHTNGTIDLNQKTFVLASSYTTATGTKNLTFNGGVLNLTGASTVFSNAAPTGFTTTAGSITGGQIRISGTGGSVKSFGGGTSTFNCTLVQATIDDLNIGGAVFDNITNSTQPTAIYFGAGTSTTFNNFNLNGTAGNLVSLFSTSTGISYTITKSGGVVSCNYLNIQDCAATPADTWYAGTTSTDAGNNTVNGWNFTSPPTPGGNTGAFFSIL
jgi:hypothetical protein